MVRTPPEEGWTPPEKNIWTPPEKILRTRLSSVVVMELWTSSVVDW